MCEGGGVIVAVTALFVCACTTAQMADLIEKGKASGDVQTLLLHRLPSRADEGAEEEKKVNARALLDCSCVAWVGGEGRDGVPQLVGMPTHFGFCISTVLGHRMHCKGVGVGGLVVVAECFHGVAVGVGGGGGPCCLLYVRGV